MQQRKTKLGQKIANLRKERGLSQERLGQISKIHRTYISEIERGEANVSLEHLCRLADSLEISLSSLFDINDEKDTKDY